MRIWVASLIFYGSVFAVCELLRFLVIKSFDNPKRLSALLVLEFIGTLQICVPMFDVGTILENYGLLGVFVEITVIELANCYFQRDAVAHPCPLVAITTGCIIEGAATFLAKWFEKLVDEKYDGDVKLCSIANCLFSGLLCAIGINYTGMYANPIVAWACTFNCLGVSHTGHLFVYWLSPLIAWYFGEIVFGAEDVIEEEEKEVETVKKDAKKTE
uniref:Aquaporin n=2 Tax=Caenorhabditis japonica TaxID=281687 RepID=A0A8R1DUF8_CAEJA